MSLILVISILIRLVAMVCSVAVWRRIGNWRMGFLTVMLALMAVRQTLTLLATRESWTVVVSGDATELPGLIVSVMAFMAVFFLNRLLAEGEQAEVAVRVSEARYRAVVESMPECVMLVDANTRLLDMNPAGLAMIGAESLEQVKGGSLSELVAPKDRSAFEDLHARIFHGEPGELELDCLGVKGTYHRVEAHAVPLRDMDGRITALLAVMRDITERTRSEKALLESEQRYRSLTDDVLDSSAVGIFILDAAFRVVWVNSALERYFGLRRNDVIGRDKRQLIRKRI